EERVLNYLPREQMQKLSIEGRYAIRDALVSGRGCLWAESYSFPASDRTLAGLFHDNPENLFIDSDCRDAGLKTATWIARKHVNTHWEVERRFNLEEGSLKRYSQLSTHDAE